MSTLCVEKHTLYIHSQTLRQAQMFRGPLAGVQCVLSEEHIETDAIKALCAETRAAVQT